ncbi:hypothetical protein [Enterocloster hominis (ex Hitch et al. 2024)]
MGFPTKWDEQLTERIFQTHFLQIHSDSRILCMVYNKSI